ncbi:MAG: VOC family protein [Chloroflexi bacterium]|nr:VOC family protein [Chloroflexota bacterium]
MLPPQTHMGAVALTVSDLSRSLAYYEQIIGLRQLRREDNTAVLGAGTAELLTLHEQKGAQPAPRHTGLFHFALLLPTRRDLALVLRHLAQKGADLGASDHGVSEALYLNDPDGHGIEIYRDRPRAEWPMANGALEMVTARLNAPTILAEIGVQDVWQGLPEGTVMGHMHLQVADIPTAEQFYTQIIGFDPMQRYGRQASFVSAGGYHHHLGFNTWNSAGATPPPAGSAALNHYTIVLPDTTTRDAVVERLTAAHIPTHPHAQGIFFQDPFQIGVVLAVSC